MSDPVNPKLREIEKEIDKFYFSNPLIEKNFANAVWFLLAVSEDSILIPFIRSLINEEKIPLQVQAMISDQLVNGLNYPLHWLKSSCKPNGKVIPAHSDDDYEAAKNLLKLGISYPAFETAYTYASLGLVNLELNEREIIPDKPIYLYWEYEAYNRLIRSTSDYINLDFERFPKDSILRTLRVDKDRFYYKINPRIIAETIEFLQPLIQPRFKLPEDWQFSKFTLGDFKFVYESIFAMSYIHSYTRHQAAARGCDALGFLDCVKILNYDAIVSMVRRYSGVDESKVKIILDYLTYGSQGMRKPDPALQPLIKINSEEFIIMPKLWTSINAERNFTVLLNRLPSERKIYLKLVNTKEELMKEKILSEVKGKNFRIESGTIPNNSDIPDIDIAIIDDISKMVLFIELKWFIEPAGVRECLEKSEQLSKGISQLLILGNEFVKKNQQLLEKLKVDMSYSYRLLLVSANWIGFADIQHKEVPIIQERHIIEKLKKVRDLRELSEWLEQRKYLPKQGAEFNIEYFKISIGQWNLNWFGIKPLIKDEFLPV